MSASASCSFFFRQQDRTIPLQGLSNLQSRDETERDMSMRRQSFHLEMLALFGKRVRGGFLLRGLSSRDPDREEDVKGELPERADLVSAEFDLPTERLMCAGLIRNE